MAKGEPHPLTGHLPPDRPHWGGEPLPTGHTPPGATLAKRGGGPPPHWPEKGRAPLGEPHHARPPTGQTGRPTLATYRPSDAPPGPMATASLTGHLLAIRGGLPLAKGEAPTGHRTGAFARPSPDWPKGREGVPMATRELQPPTSRPPMAKGEPPPSLASHWPPTGHKGAGRGRLRPALPRLTTYAPTPHTSR
jgi:hypothetical protein